MQPIPESKAAPRSGLFLRWLLLLCVLAVGLAVGAAAGYRHARQSAAATDTVVITAEQAAAQDAAIRQSQAESRFLRAQLDTADGEIAVERAARQELEIQLRSAQAEIGRVRDRLAFFEQLLPPGPEGAVDIRGAEIQREGQGLKYRVLLMRSGRSETPFTGMLRFQAAGILKGETVSVDLAPMQLKADTPADPGAVPASGGGPLALQFDQYQRSEGVLELPPGFVPETVTISVLEGSTVRASRNIKLEF
ncbi:MAG TPA: DUF6776 family protein [Bordetella sp.]|nr:DUF6776 family protein [Bordetella sp.]